MFRKETIGILKSLIIWIRSAHLKQEVHFLKFMFCDKSWKHTGILQLLCNSGYLLLTRDI